jgi:deoxycitidine kinase/deoxyguanosine kinase
MVRIYSIEGNIGAGKTTLLSYIENMIINENQNQNQNQNQIILMREPVDIWTSIVDVNGVNLLQNFYKDTKKYAFPFQIFAFSTRLTLLKNTLKNNPECEILICERSLYADGNIFAKMLYDDRMMDETQYQIYTKMYDDAIHDYPLSGVIYLTIPPSVCAKRIVKRNRAGEENIEMKTLEKLHTYHEKWLNEPELGFYVLQMDKVMVDDFIANGNVYDLII